jgi:hypothetical protein
MRRQASRLCRQLLLTARLVVAAAGLTGTSARAQIDGGTSYSGPENTIPYPGVDRDEPKLEWIFFPVNPPVLGAEVAVAAASQQSRAPAVLRAFLSDPFFPQLAARVVQLKGEDRRLETFSQEEFARLDAFVSIRATLLKEIYARADQLWPLAPSVRHAAFEELARRQQSRLSETERSAEWLRVSLAKGNTWNEHRTWRLGSGAILRSQEKTYVLEFQVVRAAAYYQEGFSSAQRRLVRELAVEMSETIAKQKGAAVGSDVTMFFSPDTARILRPQTGSPELEAKIVEYIGEKRRLKDELRRVIYDTDAVLLEYTRTKRIEELARAQADAIERLEGLAEEIRLELATLAEYRRYRGGPRLSAGLEERLQAFADEENRIEAERATFIRARVQQARNEARAAPAGTVVRESAARAGAVFELEQGNRLMAHERRSEALLEDLARELPAEEAGRLNGPAGIALRDFIERRAEQDAYADYDLAVLEPGLSPAQRRLVFAAAIARLRQVMLPPEKQPTKPPGTLLGIGK